MSNEVAKVWGPTERGMAFTGTGQWSFAIAGSRFKLVAERREWAGSVLDMKGLKLETGLFWASLEFPWPLRWRLDGRVRVDGIPNLDALQLANTVAKAIANEERRVAAIAKRLKDARPEFLAWARSSIAACEEQLRARGWLTKDFKLQKPEVSPMQELVIDSAVLTLLNDEPEDVKRALRLWMGDYGELNAKHLSDEKSVSSDFFSRIEARALTEEQIDAVVCFDKRLLVVAAAGSGKTSTMVAKAAYAIHKKYVSPENILLLAFNNDAASELRHRLKARFGPLGLPTDGLTAKTFHAFGLDVIGAATGKRPSLAPWLEGGEDLKTLLSIAEELRTSNLRFRRNWDLLRVVFGQDLPAFEKEEGFPDSWDPSNRRRGFRTLNDEVVKSRGEQTIADWLFYNGVAYTYEKKYEHETADSQHRQYCPDFYLESIGAYLEHWALDHKGNPPPEFHGYADGMRWKRSLHAAHATVLLETTSAQLRSGEAFSYLERELVRLGAVLDPNPDRPVRGRTPVESPRLARTFRTFQTHAKSNRLSAAMLRARLQEQDPGQFSFRHGLFLDLYALLASAWEERLRAQSYIDFEDMMQLAADHIEAETWTSPFELVMVDEFQDASQARARILVALTRRPETRLFAVGDDWQSINRFAGADLSVMTGFSRIFGESVTLKLEQTFRCPQKLCDISSQFVQKNANQLTKRVRSHVHVDEPIRIVSVVDLRSEGAAAVAAALADISARSVGRTTVFLLGRYNNDKRYLPAAYDSERLEVRFTTIHASKGMEADHIIVPGMTSGTLGFPSNVADDAVLNLAMPKGDSYPYAEERRLFYVALTRARQSVTLITQAGKESAFVLELASEHGLTTYDSQGEVTDLDYCPSCSSGVLIQRTSKHGKFFGCSQFPRCDYTKNIGPQRTRQRGASHRSVGAPR